LERTEAPTKEGSQMNEPSLLSGFYGKNVLVQVEKGFVVEGRLTSFQTNSKETHEPNILVLDGKRLVRGNYIFLSVVEK